MNQKILKTEPGRAQGGAVARLGDLDRVVHDLRAPLHQ
jgi:hypothetical protein